MFIFTMQRSFDGVGTHLPLSYRKSNKIPQCIRILFHICIKLNMFRATRRPSSRAQNCTSSLWFCIGGRLLEVQLLDAVRQIMRRCRARHLLILCLTASSNYTSNNLPRMQTQRLLVQFQSPDDGRCIARNMLSFI